MVPSLAWNWLAANAVPNPPEQKNETERNVSSLRKKFDSSVARSAQFSSHPARVGCPRLLCPFAASSRKRLDQQRRRET
jgi:hypothetical protein